MATNLTKEQIEALLLQNNLTFSDIAKLANEVNQMEDQPLKVKKTSTTPTTTVYKIQQISYPDVVIRRQRGKNISSLIIAPSCSGYYVKKGTEVIKLNSDVWVNFFSDLKEPIILEDFWIPEIHKTKVYYDNLSKMFEYESLIKNHIMPEIDIDALDRRGYNWQTQDCIDKARQLSENIKIYGKPFIELLKNSSEKIYKILTDKNSTVIHTLRDIYLRFGLNNFKEFLNNLDMCLIPLDSRWSNYNNGESFDKEYEVYYTNNCTQMRYSLLPSCTMKFKAFQEYVLYQSWRMGYEEFSRFCSDWRDDLRQQYLLHGKIKEKYPETLQTHHMVVSRQYKAYKEIHDTELFIQRVENYKKYETKIDNYIFIAPKDPKDMIDEATQQSNCLASYVNRVIDGSSQIIFMRDKKTPEKSLITMEIANGRITQALKASNRDPEEAYKVVIRNFAKKYDLIYNY